MDEWGLHVNIVTHSVTIFWRVGHPLNHQTSIVITTSYIEWAYNWWHILMLKGVKSKLEIKGQVIVTCKHFITTFHQFISGWMGHMETNPKHNLLSISVRASSFHWVVAPSTLEGLVAFHWHGIPKLKVQPGDAACRSCKTEMQIWNIWSEQVDQVKLPKLKVQQRPFQWKDTLRLALSWKRFRQLIGFKH